MLCGGVSALVKAGFETLVKAGYQPEIAYFECMHELKLIVDLFYRGGLNYMRYSVSDTAEHGDYTGGPRMVTDETRAAMQQVLQEIQDGTYARKWIDEDKAGRPWFMAQRRQEQAHQIEKVGLGAAGDDAVPGRSDAEGGRVAGRHDPPSGKGPGSSICLHGRLVRRCDLPGRAERRRRQEPPGPTGCQR